MQKICANHWCKQSFEITSEDIRFYEDVSPMIAGKKYSVPSPTLCPDCRFQRRQLFRNERCLYHRKSDLSGKQIVSIYASDKPYIVYDQDEFWSDQWDDLVEGRDFDFGKTFTEQFSDLGLRQPHMSLITTNVENSYYTNHALNMRNCYLLFGGGNSEDCMFGRFIVNSKDILDGLSLYSCERCYEGVASEKCYNCLYFQNCRNCSDSLMIEDCQNCRHCFLCFGLQNSEYCILNEKFGKEVYEQRLKEILPLTQKTIVTLRARLLQLTAKLPHRSAHIFNSENCSGDMIFNSKNCLSAFDTTDSEDSKFLCYTPKTSHSYDCTYNAPDGVQWAYEAGSTVGVHNAMSTFLCWYGSDLLYCRECHHCRDCFGCISLKKRQYCIFNKQYTKGEYETLVPKIIEHMKKTGEWGEYFSPSLSYMGYNETVAQETSSLIEKTVLDRKWNWYSVQDKKEAYLGPKANPPPSIQDVADDICEQILLCEVTQKPFKIIPQELEFYRSIGIPIPNKSPDQRHKERLALRNPSKLWDRKCAKCDVKIQTTYAPERSEKVLCESCYLTHIL